MVRVVRKVQAVQRVRLVQAVRLVRIAQAVRVAAVPATSAGHARVRVGRGAVREQGPFAPSRALPLSHPSHSYAVTATRSIVNTSMTSPTFRSL
jgi:hypothetical protein